MNFMGSLMLLAVRLEGAVWMPVHFPYTVRENTCVLVCISSYDKRVLQLVEWCYLITCFTFVEFRLCMILTINGCLLLFVGGLIPLFWQYFFSYKYSLLFLYCSLLVAHTPCLINKISIVSVFHRADWELGICVCMHLFVYSCIKTCHRWLI